MRPSPLAEAELTGLAERCGRQVGAVFRLTKAAIVKAALIGITADSAIETLTRLSRKPLPENVRLQILDWFKSCREVAVRRSMLLTVPDEETATQPVG